MASGSDSDSDASSGNDWDHPLCDIGDYDDLVHQLPLSPLAAGDASLSLAAGSASLSLAGGLRLATNDLIPTPIELIRSCDHFICRWLPRISSRSAQGPCCQKVALYITNHRFRATF
jgi:hypothetical protein